MCLLSTLPFTLAPGGGHGNCSLATIHCNLSGSSRVARIFRAAGCDRGPVAARFGCDPAERCSLAANTMAHARFRGANAAHRAVHAGHRTVHAPVTEEVGRGAPRRRGAARGAEARRSEPAPSDSGKTVANHPMVRRDRAKAMSFSEGSNLLGTHPRGPGCPRAVAGAGGRAAR